MTSLSPSPLIVALVQTANSLPFFLLALPAGALGDIVDRRRLLLLTEGIELAGAAVLGVFTVLGLTDSQILLFLTFIIGIGAALNEPAWQAITPEVVPRSALPAAVTLSSAGVNLGRVIGPALAGFAIVSVGAGAVFLLNSVSFLGVLAVLYRWQRPERRSTLQSERIVGAIRASIRYTRHAPALKALIVRAGTFAICGSALWALIPVVSRQNPEFGAVGYGVLLGSLGTGALTGAIVLPRLRRQIRIDLRLVAATVLFAGATVTLGLVRDLGILVAAMFLAGIAWITLISSFNTAAQTFVQIGRAHV